MKRIIDFDDDVHTFRGPIVDWCNTLNDTTICTIRLFLNSGPPHLGPSSVVVSLQDASIYRIQRDIKRIKIIPDVQDTIEQLPDLDLGTDLGPRPLVTIDFQQNRHPSLLFLLRVCHAIRVHGPFFKATHLVMDCSNDFFPVALVMIVTRSCLPFRDLAPASSTPLGQLWQDIHHLIHRQGRGFWDHTIVEYTKSAAKELVYRLGQHKILLLQREQDQFSPKAAATMARIGSLAENKELSDSAIWEKAWDSRWKEVWQQHWLATQPRNSGGIQAIANAVGIITNVFPSVDGRSPGRAAGRALVKCLPTENSKIILRAILDDLHRQSSRIQRNESHMAMDSLEVDCQTSNPDHDTLIQQCIPTAIWSGRLCLPLNAETYQMWTIPREAAIESAWEAAWEDAVLDGRNIARDVLSHDYPLFIHATPGQPELIAGYKSRRRYSPRELYTAKWLGNRHSSMGTTVHSAESTEKSAIASLWNPSITKTISSSPTTIAPAFDTTSSSISESITPVKGMYFPESDLHSHVASGDDTQRVPYSSFSSYPSSTHMDLGAQLQAEIDPRQSSRETVAVKPFTTDISTHSPMRHNSDPAGSPLGHISHPMAYASTRRENLVKLLRRYVLKSRFDDAYLIHPISQLEDAFRQGVQERHYLESKEVSMMRAAEWSNDLDFRKIKPMEADIQQMAEEAWIQALSGENGLRKMLKVLARLEWEKQVEQHRKSPLSTRRREQPDGWEADFMSTWEQAWKKSWAAAWTAVWDLTYREATSKGIEFGVGETFEIDSRFQRASYKELESTSSYQSLCISLLHEGSPSESLDQIRQWIKEIDHLSESMRHSVPTLCDGCMVIKITGSNEIQVQEPPTFRRRFRKPQPKTRLEPVATKVSHDEFQAWVTNDLIMKKIGDNEKLYKLFLRGLEDVWESVSGERGDIIIQPFW